MKRTKVYPNYYPSFSCIGGACGHNCCIGWEIDIDGESLSRYDAESSPFGERLRAGISREGTPHFRLCENERCVFLNNQNLCELILEMGEDFLCEICAEHPRFRNFLPGREEIGLGLCCEAAGRLILGQSEPVRLLGEGSMETDDEVLLLREDVIAALQDRSRTVWQRLEAVQALCGGGAAPMTVEDRCGFLLTLERLEERWTERLEETIRHWRTADREGFARHMVGRETEYEQLAVYLIYRHFANAEEMETVAAVADFAAWGCELLYAMGAVQYTRTGKFTLADQVELARELSAELEYSEENMEKILKA